MTGRVRPVIEDVGVDVVTTPESGELRLHPVGLLAQPADDSTPGPTGVAEPRPLR